ncbi:MAG: hypothetical protein ACYS0H_27745, partial [Planctomycetota bacterium]
WNDLFLNDSGTIWFGDDQDVSFVHVADTGLQMALDDSIMFGDTAVFIESDDDGYLDLDADTGIRLNAATTVTGLITGTAGVNLGTSQALLGTTAITIGNNGQTVAVNSSDWDIDATGVMTGIGNITSDGTLVIVAVDGSGTISGNLFTPDAADGADIGSAALEFSDIYLAAGSIIYGEDDQGNTITSSATGWAFNLDITVGGGNINTGDIALVVGDATTDTIQLLTDGTGDAEVALPTGSISGTEILDDTIDSADYAAASIDNEHLADNAVDSAELAAGSVMQQVQEQTTTFSHIITLAPILHGWSQAQGI